MSLVNFTTREITCKIVYYGPGRSGKTSNLQYVYGRVPESRRGRMVSLATQTDRTLFFDFLPIDLGTVNGFLTRFHLYTVPGQVYYKLSRRAVLQGVDGLVFVADSHPARETANRESLNDLNEHLRTLGLTGPALARIPWVFQYNKRDVPVALPIERLKKALNPNGWPEYEATASEGKGVSETLRAACKAVLARLGAGQAAPASPQVAASGAAVAAAAGPAPRVAGPGASSSATATADEAPAAEPTTFAGQLARAAASAAAKLAAASGPRPAGPPAAASASRPVSPHAGSPPPTAAPPPAIATPRPPGAPQSPESLRRP